MINQYTFSVYMNRPTVDEYFMSMAALASERSTCLRRKVGAVIVKDKQVISTGYNGAPKDMAHCGEAGCLRENMGAESGTRHELCRGVHAEQNAVIQAAVFGVSVKGGTLYTTHHPCVLCVKIVINAGLERIVYKDGYPDELAEKMIMENGIQIEKFTGKKFYKSE